MIMCNCDILNNTEAVNKNKLEGLFSMYSQYYNKGNADLILVFCYIFSLCFPALIYLSF